MPAEPVLACRGAGIQRGIGFLDSRLRENDGKENKARSLLQLTFNTPFEISSSNRRRKKDTRGDTTLIEQITRG